MSLTEEAKSKKRFAGSNRLENAEVRDELNSADKTKVRAAIKKVIASMAQGGGDVSTLYGDVAKHLTSQNYDLKKLVYVFVANYSHIQPEKIMEDSTVQVILRDTRDPSPLLRALALRTLSSIRHERTMEYVINPLREALRDKDSYVRKTAAVCVTKLYLYRPEQTEKEGFLDKLKELLSDPVPLVVTNAVAGIADITARTGTDLFGMNAGLIQKLLAALNESTEWGQVFILDALATYRPGAKEAEGILDRVAPRLQHSNAAVATSAVRVIVNLLGQLDASQEDFKQQFLQTRLPPPLITLLADGGNQPEMQYVTLRSINLLVQKWPDLLSKEIKHFFCKYNDPIYIKLEKLQILSTLASLENVDPILLEFREYAKEVDVEFVRSAVRAIGRCAIKLDGAAERCVKVLLELIQTKVNYVVQESVIVIKDIFRKYPNKYESIISTLCENLDTLDEPEAKASMIWIIGEYANRIENVPSLLEDFVETFVDEPAKVQLQLLTAVVKFFLRRPDEAKEMVQRVLALTTEHAENPDLRDRGFMYWRLLSTDPDAAQKVVLAEKPTISEETFKIEASVLEMLLANLGTLAAVYHKAPETFVKGGKTLVFKGDDDGDDADEDEDEDEDEEGEEEEAAPVSKQASVAAAAAAGAPLEIDFLTDLAGGMSVGESASSPVVRAPIVLPEDNKNCPGVQIRALAQRQDGQIRLRCHIVNKTGTQLNTFLLKFNKNALGYAPIGSLQVSGGVPSGGQNEGWCAIGFGGAVDPASAVDSVQVALKTELGVCYFVAPMPVSLVFEDNARLGQKEFIDTWKQMDHEEKADLRWRRGTTPSADAVNRKLEANRVYLVAKRTVQGKGDCLYSSVRIKGTWVLLEVAVGPSGLQGAAKCNDVALAKAALAGIDLCLSE